MARIQPPGNLPSPVDLAWTPWEGRIASWQDAVEQVDKVANITAGKTVVWRGVVDAAWPMYSSLRRRVHQFGRHDPDEALLQGYEREILRRCRGDWRYDNLTTLELFAHLQHFGGPTRLIDVTLNPLVALWFAVEQKFLPDGSVKRSTDGRLFAFSVENRITLGEHGEIDWGSQGLPWEGLTAANGWGKYDRPPVLWVPPAYNERISAQNAGFLIGGTPASGDSGNKWSKGPGKAGFLRIGDVTAASSLYITPANTERAAHPRSYRAYNFRVTSHAKESIRGKLEKLYGYRSPTIYPDLYGMAQDVLRHPLP